jgi:hypothetical protein
MITNGRWLIVALLIALGGCGPSGLPATPLFVGVEGHDYAQGSQLIQDRLAARFPTGSSVRELRVYLEQQGLQVEPTARSSRPNSGVAFFKYGGPVCGSQVRVGWEANAAGKVESINALYSDTGCP